MRVWLGARDVLLFLWSRLHTSNWSGCCPPPLWINELNPPVKCQAPLIQNCTRATVSANKRASSNVCLLLSARGLLSRTQTVKSQPNECCYGNVSQRLICICAAGLERSQLQVETEERAFQKKVSVSRLIIQSSMNIKHSMQWMQQCFNRILLKKNVVTNS